MLGAPCGWGDGPSPVVGASAVKHRSRWGQGLEAPENCAEGLEFDVVETTKNIELTFYLGRIKDSSTGSFLAPRKKKIL